MSVLRAPATLGGVPGLLLLGLILPTLTGCGRREDSDRVPRQPQEVATESRSEATGARRSVVVCFGSVASDQTREFEALLRREVDRSGTTAGTRWSTVHAGEPLAPHLAEHDVLVAVDGMGRAAQNERDALGKQVKLLVAIGRCDEWAWPRVRVTADPARIGQALARRLAASVPGTGRVLVLATSAKASTAEHAFARALAGTSRLAVVRRVVTSTSAAPLKETAARGFGLGGSLAAVAATGSQLTGSLGDAMRGDQPGVWLVGLPDDWNTPLWPAGTRRQRCLGARTDSADAASRAGKFIARCLSGDEPAPSRIAARFIVLQGTGGL